MYVKLFHYINNKTIYFIRATSKAAFLLLFVFVLKEYETKTYTF